jgi:hypothetical protein
MKVTSFHLSEYFCWSWLDSEKQFQIVFEHSVMSAIDAWGAELVWLISCLFMNSLCRSVTVLEGKSTLLDISNLHRGVRMWSSHCPGYHWNIDTKCNKSKRMRGGVDIDVTFMESLNCVTAGDWAWKLLVKMRRWRQKQVRFATKFTRFDFDSLLKIFKWGYLWGSWQSNSAFHDLSSSLTCLRFFDCPTDRTK